MLSIHQITRCIYVHICIHTRIPKIIYIVIKCSFWHLNAQLIVVSLLAEPVKTNARPEVRESRVVSAFSSLYPLSHPHLPPPSFLPFTLHTHALPFHQSTKRCSPSMASLPNLLHSNALSAKSCSVILSDRGKQRLLFVDLIGINCKSKAARRRIGVSGLRNFCHFSYSSSSKSLPAAVKAVIEHDSSPVGESTSQSEPKTQVIFVSMFVWHDMYREILSKVVNWIKHNSVTVPTRIYLLIGAA